MKTIKLFLILFTIFLFISTISFSQSITVKEVTSNVAIDGQLEESFWNILNPISINLGGSNNTVNFGVLWDDNYLYIGVKVVDESLQTNGRQGFYDDGVEIYIDGNNSQVICTPFSRHKKNSILEKTKEEECLRSKGENITVLN